MITRIGQVRGLCLFAPAMTRLGDIKEYEESERIAAKVAASLCAIITVGTAEDYQAPKDAMGNPLPASSQPEMRMSPGMIMRGQPGEDVKMIDSKRPNPQVEPFRNGQLRMAAAGFEISYSSFSKNYNGTYSSQRQELVEQDGAYGGLSADFINMSARPTYEGAMSAAFASGVIDLRKFSDVDPESLLDPFYVRPPMPWINPVDEVEALQMMEESCFMSGPEIIRRSGRHANDVLQQESAWRSNLKKNGVETLVTGQVSTRTTRAFPTDQQQGNQQ
jgi:lambda family phage portal protein